MRGLLQLIVISLTALGITSFVGEFLIKRTAERELIELKSDISNQKELNARRKALTKQLEKLKTYEGALAPSEDPAWLMREVTGLAQAMDVQIGAISPRAPKSIDLFTYLTIDIKLVTTYHQLGQFIDSLEHHNKFIRTDLIKMSKSNESVEAVSVELILSSLYAPLFKIN